MCCVLCVGLRLLILTVGDKDVKQNDNFCLRRSPALLSSLLLVAPPLGPALLAQLGEQAGGAGLCAQVRGEQHVAGRVGVALVQVALQHGALGVRPRVVQLVAHEGAELQDERLGDHPAALC